MIFMGVLIGIIIMGATAFMAIDKKSNFQIRLVSLGALALMIITLIICIVVVLTDNRVPVDESVLIVGAPAEIKDESDSHFLAIFLSIIFLLLLFAAVFFLAMKEHHRSDVKKPGIAGLK